MLAVSMAAAIFVQCPHSDQSELMATPLMSEMANISKWWGRCLFHRSAIILNAYFVKICQMMKSHFGISNRA